MQTLKLAGKKFVVLAESEYRKLEQRASAAAASSKRQPRLSVQDRGDIAEAKRRLADPKEVPIPWEKVKQELRRGR